MAMPRVGRKNSVTVEARKVALLGAAGGIGQPLALLLKMNKLVTDLALYDIANVVGVAADISHCNTPVKVRCGLEGGATPPISAPRKHRGPSARPWVPDIALQPCLTPIAGHRPHRPR